ncbi:MAG: RnfABCDGE type electron transport complex subunit B [Spirochaetales bacterium]|nr:RnfABCDGE type electron transport complex subunit B [Spirochaetales bacterium]
MVTLLLNILAALLTVGGLGILFGIGLAFASKVLEVKKDERVSRLEEILPSLNCGACGFAGCVSYAEAIVGADAALTLCTAGGAATAEELAAVMGVKVEVSMDKKVTQVHCRGGKTKATYEFIYEGIHDCNALYPLYGGNKVCKHGCLGLGSCIRVCPVDAIDYDDEGLVWVDKDKCISCGNCITVCPTGVMQFIPYNADVLVACNSTDKGAQVKKACKVGCIGCKICEKKSPEGGFIIESFLAKIDYNAQGERENALLKCPQKCIIRNDKLVKD